MANLARLQCVWRWVTHKKLGKVGWSQFGKAFVCQTEYFVFGHRGNRETLWFIELERNMARSVLRNITMITIWRIYWRQYRFEGGKPIRRLLQQSKQEVMRAWTSGADHLSREKGKDVRNIVEVESIRYGNWLGVESEVVQGKKVLASEAEDLG